jgi:2-polyprenyl-3-methyl-5-hydroxy-6-metoxy-1,4-benzoquinol methylase
MKVLCNKTEQKFNEPKFLEGIKDIEKLSGAKGRLLDVGCAVGQFLLLAKKCGWNVRGIELNKEEMSYCRRLGLDVIDRLLDDGTFANEEFDAVTLWEVLEHVMDPRAVLKNANRILKKGGALLIVVPNVDSLAARIMHEKCNMFSGMSHITMFNDRTLSRLVEDEGFRVVSKSTIISEISVVNNYLQYEHPYTGSGDERLPVFDMMDEKFILKNMLGYKLRFLMVKR